jgi:hypothetical protein
LPALFDRVGTGLRHLAVLWSRAAAGADRTDDLAAGDDRHAALERDRAMQRQDRVATTGEGILEDLCRSTEQRGRPRLSMAISTVAREALSMRSKWIRKPPWSTIAIESGLGDFRDSRGGDLLRVFEINRRAKGRRGRRCLSPHLTGKHQPGKHEKELTILPILLRGRCPPDGFKAQFSAGMRTGIERMPWMKFE